MSGYKLFDFKADDFSGLSIPVHIVKKNILTSFPVLAKFPEFATIIPGLSKDKILAYIVYMYDYKSPLRDRIEDMKLRKFNAINLAGYSIDPNIGDFKEEVNNLLLNQNYDVVQMIFRYAMWHRGGRYGYLVSLQEGAYAAQQKLITGEIKDLNALKTVHNEIDMVVSELLAEDNMNNLHASFLDYISLESLGLSPEEVAQAKRDGEQFLLGVDPYGLGNKKKHRLTSIKEKHEKAVQEKYGL